jgi:hypothetical protein
MKDPPLRRVFYFRDVLFEMLTCTMDVIRDAAMPFELRWNCGSHYPYMAKKYIYISLLRACLALTR